MRALTIAALLATGLAACGDPSLSWSVGFASDDTRGRAARIELVVTTDGCEGNAAVYRADVLRGETPTAIGALAAGTYGFTARAFDNDCRLIGQSCVLRTLPQSDRTLRLTIDDAVASGGCNAGQMCSSGRCMAIADGSVADAGDVCSGALLCDDFAGGIADWDLNRINPEGAYEPTVLASYAGRNDVLRTYTADGSITFISRFLRNANPTHIYVRAWMYLPFGTADQIGLQFEGAGSNSQFGFYYRAGDGLAYVEADSGGMFDSEGMSTELIPFDRWFCLRLEFENDPVAADDIGAIRVHVDETMVLQAQMRMGIRPEELAIATRDFTLASGGDILTDSIIVSEQPVPCR